MKHKTNKRKRSLLLAVAAFFLIYTALVASNFFENSYDALNTTDQAVLSELNTLFNSEKEKNIWMDYRLLDHTILAINTEGVLHYAYLVNPEKEVHSLFAREIQLPVDFSIKVYRISAVFPQMAQFLLPSNFNTIGTHYSVCGNDVYFTKFNADSFGKKYDSRHYITFLSHEAFHYFMQNDWAGGERFDTSELTAADLELMVPLYETYKELLDELEKTPVDKEKIIELAKRYVAISSERYQANPTYMKAEALAETAEGTATYIGLHASEAVGYDFGIMTVNGPNNEKTELPVDLIVPMLKDGRLDKSTIASNFVYDTGALLCELLDALEVTDWQKRLNNQTKEKTVTLYSLIADYVSEFSEE